MAKGNRERKLIAYTGAAALATLVLNLLISAVNSHGDKIHKKKGSSVRINLSAAEIKKVADHIIAKSKNVYDSIASVPLDKVTNAKVVAPLVELEAYQFPLVQSRLYPKMVSTEEDVRKASADAETRLDSFFLMCR